MAGSRAASLGPPMPANFFGMQGRRIQSSDSPRTPLHADLGYTVFRVAEPLQSKWRNYEPTQGNFTFTNLTQIIDDLTTAGKKPMLCFGGVPDWATDNVLAQGQVPRVAPYRAMAVRVAQEFAGRGMIYEIGNEWDYAMFFAGTVDDAIPLCSGLPALMKAADPTCKVYTPSVTADGVRWMAKFLAAGAGAGCDGVTYHPYIYPGEPERMIDRTAEFRAVCDRFGFSRLINTEFTWNSFRLAGTKYDWPVLMQPAMGASYLVRGLICSYVSGVDETYFFGLDDDDAANAAFSTIQMTDPANRSVKLAPALAYKQFTTLFAGGTLARQSFEQTYPRFEIHGKTADGRFCMVTWCCDGRSVQIDLSAYSAAADVLGNALAPSGSFTVTSSPVYAFR